jgi:hypothetical protein
MITTSEILNDPILFGLYLVIGLIAFTLLYFMIKDFSDWFVFSRGRKNE